MNNKELSKELNNLKVIEEKLITILLAYGFEKDGNSNFIYSYINENRDSIKAVILEDRIAFEIWKINLGEAIKLGNFYFDSFDDERFKVSVRLQELKVNIEQYIKFLNIK